MDQQKILEIIRSWRINKKPEYRGFRCADCQKHMRRAWHIWLTDGGYKSEVHLCKECGRKYNIR